MSPKRKKKWVYSTGFLWLPEEKWVLAPELRALLDLSGWIRLDLKDFEKPRLERGVGERKVAGDLLKTWTCEVARRMSGAA